MKNEYISSLDDFFAIFDESISAGDILASKILSEISAALAKKRIELGMTQKQFAEYMDVSQGMVSKWESSDYNFSIRNLADIAVKLNLNLSMQFSKPMTKREHMVYEYTIFAMQNGALVNGWTSFGSNRRSESVNQNCEIKAIQINNGGNEKWFNM